MKASGSLYILAVLLSLGCIGWAQDSALDLTQTLQAAESSNLELRAIRQQRAVALAGLQIARQILNPVVTFGALRDSPHENLLYDQPIELGGKRGKRIAVAQEEQKISEVAIGILSRHIRRRTREAFYRVLSSQAQTEQSKSAMELAARLKDIVQQRYDAGDVAQLDVIQSDVELARATADFEAVAQAQKSAGAELAALLSRPLDQQWNLQSALDKFPGERTLQAATDLALRSNSEVQLALQEMQVEQRRLALAKAQRIPNVDVQVGSDFNSPPDFNIGPRGQLSVTLPLFYHGQGEVAQSTARLDFLRLSVQALQTNASAQVAAAYYDYVAKARQAMQYSQKIVPETVQLEQMAEDSYRSGKSNLLTLIDAQRRLNDTRKTYLDSLFAVQSSFAVLEEVVGTPLD
jgi:outer membrane protein, heavy metal efflux system